MPKVCVVEMTGYCDQCCAQYICGERGGTDWEEVSEEDLKALEQYAAKYNQNAYRHNRFMVVVREVARPTWERGVKELLKKAREVMAKEQEKLDKQKAAEEKRKEKTAKKLEEKERKKFLELKQKFDAPGQ